MKRRLPVAATFLTVIALTGCTPAPTVELHTSWSQELWNGYPDNVDRIKYEWVGDTLHVSTIKNIFSGWDVVEKRTSISIQGDRMRLCYTYIIDEEQRKLPYALASAFPLVFDFYVRGASKQEYQIDVVKNCGS